MKWTKIFFTQFFYFSNQFYGFRISSENVSGNGVLNRYILKIR